MINNDATIKDLNINYMLEYLSKTSDREINFEMSKKEICHMLKLVDDENADNPHVKNLAILMFADINDDKKKMNRKLFIGPIWKQCADCVNYIKNNFLNTIVVREENTELSRDVANYPFTAIEELVANAIVHKNYENQKAIVIYVLEDQINIINYNNPLPPV
jgi:predicted HTH transcriptional regulator